MHCYIRTDVVGYLKHKRCTTYVLWYFLVLLDNFGLAMMMDVSVCFVGCVYIPGDKTWSRKIFLAWQRQRHDRKRYLWSDELPAIDFLRLLQHQLGSIQQILLLQCKSGQGQFFSASVNIRRRWWNWWLCSDCGAYYQWQWLHVMYWFNIMIVTLTCSLPNRRVRLVLAALCRSRCL